MRQIYPLVLATTITAIVLGGCANSAGPQASSDSAGGSTVSGKALSVIDRWVESTLTPDVVLALSEQNRFQGRSVRVVAVREGQRANHLNQLEHYAVRKVEGALLKRPNIRLLSDHSNAGQCTQLQDADIRLELALEPNVNDVMVRLRLKEVGSDAWVSGYDYQQRVELDAQSTHMLESAHTASLQRGSREAPFSVQQSDLVANALADSLVCSLGPVASPVPVVLNVLATGANSQALQQQLAAALKRGNNMRIVPSANNAQLQLNINRHDLGDGLVHVTATPVKVVDDPDMPRTAGVYQRAPEPVHRGKNWTELNRLAQQPALRQVNMDMPALVRVGETHSFSFTADQSGRFWVLQIGPNDSLEMIFPVTEAHVESGENLIAEGETRSYSFAMEPPTGDYLMSVLLTDENASIKDVLGDSSLAQFPDMTAFARKGARLLEPRDWGMMLHQMRID